VLGEILARITGRPFDALIRERMAAPLGMRRFGLYGLGSRPRSHVLPTGAFLGVDTTINLGVFGASGGAYGTIDDLWRFDHALLSGRLLRDAEREQMWIGRPENGYSGFFQWIFEAPLTGCATPSRIVERRGLIGGFEHRNILLPQTGQAVILFARKLPVAYGEIWEGKGLMYDVLSAVGCQR
jgi:CubicO group peptidase (beta-lactamase class C family)